MDYCNVDGLIVEMCGNGICVFVYYFVWFGFVVIEFGLMLLIGMWVGVCDVMVGVIGYQVDLGWWKFFGDDFFVCVDGLFVMCLGFGIDVGNLYVVVVFVFESEFVVFELYCVFGLELVFFVGVNIEFVVLEELLVCNGIGYVCMCVYECGVGEMLSCGIGVVVIVFVVCYWVGVDVFDNWQVEVFGGIFGVWMFFVEDGEYVVFFGFVQFVYQGEVDFF